MNLKDFHKSLGKNYLERIKNLKVRECDEEPLGYFVAYVDQGDTSYDVKIEFDKQKEIVNMGCDCQEKTTLCVHIVALLNHLSQAKSKLKPVLKKTRRKSKLRETLDEVPKDELIIWLEKEVKKDKSLEVRLNLAFASDKNQQKDPLIVIQNSEDVVKSMGTKRTVFGSVRMKQIIDTWKKLHQVLYTSICFNPLSKDSIQNYNTMLQGMYKINQTYHFRGARFEGYIKFRTKELVKSILSLSVKTEILDSLVGPFTGKRKGTYLNYEYILDLLIDQLTDTDKNELLGLMANNYQMANPKEIPNNHTLLFYKLLHTDELKSQYFNLLNPIPYEDTFNLELFSCLKKSQEWSRLVQGVSAVVQFFNNVETYNKFLGLLKEGYLTLEMEKEYLRIVEETIEISYDFEDYKLLLAAKREAEGKRLRNNILAKARSASTRGDLKATAFCLKLAGSEKKIHQAIRIYTQ